MHGLRWLVVVLGAFLGSWLTFDGARALAVGDYVTPRSGPHAGRLGPWSQLVVALGIEPRSPLMKWVHVTLGVLWLAASIGFALGMRAWAWWGLVACALASLWYLPVGTVVAVIELVVLLLPAIRHGAGSS